MDIKTTFLNGVVKEELCVQQPLGIKEHDRKTHVCKLKKALYKLTDGCEKEFFNKVQDRGSWYLVTLDGYIEH